MLYEDLTKKLRCDRSTPLILIKANVCRILGPKLVQDGFNVLNGSDDIIPFPSNGWQKKFCSQFGAILRSARIQQCC